VVVAHGDLLDRVVARSAGGLGVVSTSHPGKHRAHLRLGAAAAGVAALLAGCVGTGATRTAAPERTPSRRPARVLQATLAAYRLPAPLSRAVVFNAGSDLLVAGGLTAGSSSASGVFRLDPTTGTLTSDGRLAAPVHDAAGVTLGGGNLVLGGGAQATTANVQRLRDGGTAQLIGRLPQPRSDLVAATVGQAAYVLGGYDGATTLGAVLRTQDGRSFTSIGQLPVPVRYPAVAVTGRTLWVFGGEHAGQQVDTIQRIDTATGSARVAGHLQHPLAHAAALVLDGTVYLAGGRAGNSVTSQMLAFDAGAAKVTPAGQLPRPVADTAAGVVGEVGYLVGGEGPRPVSTVIKLRTVSAAATPTTQPSNRATRNAAGWPFAGRLLIADRGNNRLLLVDPAKHVLWRHRAVPRCTSPGWRRVRRAAWPGRGSRAGAGSSDGHHRPARAEFGDKERSRPTLFLSPGAVVQFARGTSLATSAG
jgi:hypothetical protein